MLHSRTKVHVQSCVRVFQTYALEYHFVFITPDPWGTENVAPFPSYLGTPLCFLDRYGTQTSNHLLNHGSCMQPRWPDNHTKHGNPSNKKNTPPELSASAVHPPLDVYILCPRPTFRGYFWFPTSPSFNDSSSGWYNCWYWSPVGAATASGTAALQSSLSRVSNVITHPNKSWTGSSIIRPTLITLIYWIMIANPPIWLYWSQIWRIWEVYCRETVGFYPRS